MRKTADELWDVMNAAPATGSRWRHASGFTTIVAGVAIFEEDCGPMVLYQHDGLPWVRRLASFLERFTPAEGATA